MGYYAESIDINLKLKDVDTLRSEWSALKAELADLFSYTGLNDVDPAAKNDEDLINAICAAFGISQEGGFVWCEFEKASSESHLWQLISYRGAHRFFGSGALKLRGEDDFLFGVEVDSENKTCHQLEGVITWARSDSNSSEEI